MKKLLYILAVATLLTACVKHDEIEFAGKVVGIRNCTPSYLDQNAGYMVQLDYPDSIGGSITAGENTAENLIVLYEPTEHIRVDDRIHGTFYLDNNYSKANCSMSYDEPLPEGVFLKVTVD